MGSALGDADWVSGSEPRGGGGGGGEGTGGGAVVSIKQSKQQPEPGQAWTSHTRATLAIALLSLAQNFRARKDLRCPLA